MLRKLLVGTIASAVAISSLTTTASAEEPESVEPIVQAIGDGPYAQVGSEIFPIEDGTKLTSGLLTPEGCVFDERVFVGGVVADGEGGQAISTHVDEQCNLTVSAVDVALAEVCQNAAGTEDPGVLLPLLAVPAMAAQDAAIQDAITDEVDDMNDLRGSKIWKGCAKYSIQEQFGVTATELYTEGQWFHKASKNKVFKGHGFDGYCSHSAFPGWKVDECDGTYWPYGRAFIWFEAHMNADNDLPPRPSYRKRLYWRVNSLNQFTYKCEMVRGSPPPSWDERCYGEKEFVSTAP